MGFPYGAGNFNSQLLGANRGEGYFAVAGLLPTTNFGPAPSLAVHKYLGKYELIYIPQNQSETDSPQKASGAFEIEIDLTSGATNVNENFMRGTSSETTGSHLSIGDGAIVGQDFQLEVSYKDTDGYVYGVFGRDGIGGAMVGESDSGMFVGGLLGSK